MIIPYSTDAPIYHFPWATIGLIVTNVLTFFLTLGGAYRWGWLLTYGDGLHPLEWVTWNFLHFGVFHLLGNMFFLWSFGIVVEGKLGWWKFLLVYLGIGTTAGFLIQVFMLKHDKEMISLRDSGNRQVVHVDRLRASVQYGGVDDFDDVMPIQLPQAVQRHQDDAQELEADEGEKFNEDNRFGAGGASAAIYGLMAIVLFWAPRNEVHCLWLMGFRGGAIEVEYLYFCGFYIFMEMVFAFYHTTRYEATSEVLHSSGAFVGAGVAVLLLRWKWVDCENWDLFSIMEGKHSAAANVGDWQSYYAVSAGHRDQPISGLVEPAGIDVTAKKKKKKAKPRLVELSEMEDVFEANIDEQRPKKPKKVSRADNTRTNSTKQKPQSDSREEPSVELEWIDEGEDLVITPPPVPSRQKPRVRSSNSSSLEQTKRLRQLLREGKFEDAYVEYLDLRSYDAGYQLPEEVLSLLANGLFRSRAATEASSLLAEFIDRFPEKADRERVKLAVLNVRYLRRPMAALKLLARIDPETLPEDYREIYRKTARYAQEMVSSGVVDMNG